MNQKQRARISVEQKLEYAKLMVIEGFIPISKSKNIGAGSAAVSV